MFSTILALVSLTLVPVSPNTQQLWVDANNPSCPGSGSPSDPYCRIQDAIVAASDGDEVLVRPGTYLERIDFLGKDLVVRSTAGAAFTIIDGGRNGSVVTFQGQEPPTAVLEGFTIQNGSGTPKRSLLLGGGVLCQASSPTLRSNTITQNSAYDPSRSYWGSGGGVHVDKRAYPRLYNNAILANHATEGGGVSVSYASVRMIGNSVGQNRSESNGGGLALSRGRFVILGNTIRGNWAFLNAGGVLIAGNYATDALIEENLVADNVAQTAAGGGVFFHSFDFGTMSITSNTITGNRAVSGGGIWSSCSEYAEHSISRNTIAGNTAYNGGGGITLTSIACRGKVVSNKITSNRSYAVGGGVYAMGWTLIDNEISSNSANKAGGGVYALDTKLVNTTIAGNSAAGGGGVYIGRSSYLALESSIVWQNYPDGIGFSAGSRADVTYSNTQQLQPGAGNISASPLFRDLPGGDARLSCSSPCIDAGAVHPTHPLPELDLSGHDLRRLGRLDMGADEAGIEWGLVGAPVVGGPPIHFTVAAPPALSGELAIVLVSTGDGSASGGIRLPKSSGRRLSLDPDPLLEIWSGLGQNLISVPLAGCSGASTQPFTIPSASPVGAVIHFAGFSLRSDGRVTSLSDGGSFTLQ